MAPKVSKSRKQMRMSLILKKNKKTLTIVSWMCFVHFLDSILSVLCSFFGKIWDFMICFWDLLTFSTLSQICKILIDMNMMEGQLMFEIENKRLSIDATSGTIIFFYRKFNFVYLPRGWCIKFATGLNIINFELLRIYEL